MGLVTTLSQKELARIAGLAYEGETLNIMLCSVGLTGYTTESLVTDWETVEISGNGYVRYSVVIGAGAYDSVDGRYEMPSIDAPFTATGAGYSFDRIIIWIEGASYIHSMIVENPNITMAAGQTLTYRVQVVTDD